MIFGILNAILSSAGDIVYKKSLLLCKGKMSDSVYQFVGGAVSIVVLGIFLYGFSHMQDIGLQFDIGTQLVAIFVLIAATGIIAEFFYQSAYKNEKISVLAPYGESEAILTILIGFFLFSDNSLVTFLASVVAGGVLIAGSLDFKKLRFNAYCIYMIIAGLLGAIKYNFYGYILLTLTPISALVFNNLFTVLLLLVLVLFQKKIRQTRYAYGKVGGLITTESLVRLIVGFVSLYLVNEFGVVQATLLSMLTLVANVVFAYFFLGEKPDKKDIVIMALVVSCVFIGSYFA